jgi:predicted regulator of Ras-like GTPase activity (Roadblock/LC7/MglB family)
LLDFDVPPGYVAVDLQATSPKATMPTLRNLLDRLANRSEVEAAVVVGQDGLLIDQVGADGSDAEAVAAMAPNLLQNARALGDAASHEDVRSAVVEYGDGVVIVTDISSDIILVTFVRPNASFGALLYELRRNREQIARLV